MSRHVSLPRRRFAALGLLAGVAATLLPAMRALAAPPAFAPASEIRIDNFVFTPATVTVSAGTTVTWVNHDDSPHTVTSQGEPRLLNSAALDTDDRYAVTFTRPGTYRYYCAIHPHMTGVVVVK